MCTAAKKDTVWMGFMDIVPVIGTVKEAVELVLALYEGSKSVIREKEKAVENLMKKHVKAVSEHKLTLPGEAAAPDEYSRLRNVKEAAAPDEYSGLRNVKEVRKEMIIEYMVKGSKRGTKPLTSAEQRERKKKLEAINKDMLQKISILDQNLYEEVKEELGRSRRGEHVFNNGILRFHFNVLTEFIQTYHIDNLHGYNQQEMDGLDRHTLPQNTANDIQTNMVVHFGGDEFYVNANGVMYGIYCRELRTALLGVLNHINPDDVTVEERERVNYVIEHMNNLEIYVDQLAKVKWIANIEARQNRFIQGCQVSFQNFQHSYILNPTDLKLAQKFGTLK